MLAPTYLNRLGLDLAADERAVKRAYARELKKIDLETDAAGFQVLRDAYEMALHWVRHNAAGVDVAPAAVEPVLGAGPESARASPAELAPSAPARDADTGDSPAQLAQAVFDKFLDVAAQTSARGEASDSLQWRKSLLRCVSDERLLSISAGAYFEFFVARLLAEGWRSGHEELFIAARQVFGWDKDRRRLVSFGHVGEWLDLAIDECGMFTQQHSADCSGQSDAIARVREDAAPSKSELLRHVPHLRNMVDRFPAWTQVIGRREHIEQWLALERELPEWRRRLRFARKPASSEPGSGLRWWQVLGFIFAIRALYGSFIAPSAPPEPPWNPPRLAQESAQPSLAEQQAEAIYQRAAGKLYMPPGTRQLALPAEAMQPAPTPQAPARRKGRMLNDAEMRAISKRVQFKAPAGPPRSYKVEFEMELDDNGAILRLTKKAASGLPELDEKTEDAIRESAPFGAQISRRLVFWFAWRPPAPQKAREPQGTPAETE